MLCKEHGFSIATDHPARLRYTLTEQPLLTKGLSGRKDEIRTAMDITIQQSNNYQNFKTSILADFGILVDDSKKHIIISIHPDNKNEM